MGWGIFVRKPQVALDTRNFRAANPVRGWVSRRSLRPPLCNTSSHKGHV